MVIFISSSRVESNATPQITFASGLASSEIIVEARSTSSSPTSGDAEILIRIPVAPLMEVSRSGLEIAIRAAFSALSLPFAEPTPM